MEHKQLLRGSLVSERKSFLNLINISVAFVAALTAVSLFMSHEIQTVLYSAAYVSVLIAGGILCAVCVARLFTVYAQVKRRSTNNILSIEKEHGEQVIAVTDHNAVEELSRSLQIPVSLAQKIWDSNFTQTELLKSYTDDELLSISRLTGISISELRGLVAKNSS